MYHFLTDGIVCGLQVEQHLSHNGLHVAATTHGVEQVDCPLTYTDVSLRLVTTTTTTTTTCTTNTTTTTGYHYHYYDYDYYYQYHYHHYY